MSKLKARRARSARIVPEALLDGLSSEELIGRLTGKPAKAERIEMRVTPAEKDLIQGLADRCGVSVTRLLVRLAETAQAHLSGLRSSGVGM